MYDVAGELRRFLLADGDAALLRESSMDTG